MAGAVAALLEANRASFGSGDSQLIERTFLVNGRRFRERLLNLVDDLSTGHIDLSQFIAESGKALRTAFGQSYLLGSLSIDTFHNLTPRDIRLIDREIAEEKHFLRNFAEDLRRGFYVMDPVQRAGFYLQALRGMFELGRIEALTLQPLLWELGPTEHCIPCIQASVNGPYKKDSLVHLDLPVLPGIPGIGDVCKGLTRCGCSIKLQDGPVPNAGISLRLRESLVEMLSD